MITPAYCVAMAEYNVWMNAKLFALCATLPDGERRRDRRAFFGSIHRTLDHVLACDAMFLASFTENAAFEACEGDLHDDFDELRRHRETLDAGLLRWAGSVAAPWLDTASTFTHHEDGVDRTVTQGFWVVHMFNHQTHHRGQVTTLLTQLGHDIGSTDLHMSVPRPGAASARDPGRARSALDGTRPAR